MADVFSHPWLSGLFADAETAAIWSAEAQLGHMLRFEAEWSRALGAAGTVSAQRATSLADQIAVFAPDLDALAAGTAKDGLPVPELVRQLKAAFGSDGVHSGATSQDVIDTALAITMVKTAHLLQSRLAGLDTALTTLAKAFGANRLMGRTRMQAATPILVRDRIAAWQGPIVDHKQRLTDILPRIARLQIGGASGDRSALGDAAPHIIAHLEQAFGMPAGEKAWHAMRDNVAEFAGLLSLISGSLGKIGQDICLMSQQGIDEVKIKGGGTSSAMPHKQNPILAELLVTLSRYNAVQLSGVHQALLHEQERSGAAWALEWMLLPPMAQATGRALSTCADLLSAVTWLGSPALR